MTTGQIRVLTLLLVLLGVQAIINPNVRSVLSGHLTKEQSQSGALGIPSVYLAGYIGVGAAAVALVALAAPAPRLATYIVLAFIALALIEHPDAWRQALSQATAGIGAITGRPAATQG